MWDPPRGDDGGGSAAPLRSRGFDLAGVRATVTVARTETGWAAVTLDGAPREPTLLAYDLVLAGERSAVKAVVAL